MEKVTIINVTTRLVKTGDVYDIQLADGRKGSSFDEKFLSLKGKEVIIEVVMNGKYLNFKLPKEEPKKEAPAPEANIKLAIALAVLANPILDTNAGLDTCQKFYAWVISDNVAG